ncbi:MAG: 16S rRNA (cytosine(1402)-N(4))-methyltransferase RsmH, partial [Micrococcales bacterium]|nr:16S rRNA (cytosine(1402)-N(4))-methyltransferase RsmH [Micrococcales bacterium]
QDTRGFAYSRPTPLDMRMDQGDQITAAQILAAYSHAELVKVLRLYGQERFAVPIASAIVSSRQVKPIETSDQLVELIRQVIPQAARRQGGHPAKRVFQALRMAVNSELPALQDALPKAIDRLRIGGRIVVMSYQSLEDQLVKRVLAVGLTNRAPTRLPVVPTQDQPYLVALTKGAELASGDERQANPRSKSLRLRAAEKTRQVSHER